MRIRRYTVGTVDLCDDCVKVYGDSDAFVAYCMLSERLPNERFIVCERCGLADKSHPDYPKYKKAMDAAYGHE